MGRERVHKKLDDLFGDKKSRNFINHLIRSYVPINKVSKVMEKPEGKFRCALSNQPLISINEILVNLHSEEFKDEFLNNIKNLFKEGDNKYKINESLLGKKSLGVQGTKTTTYMSYEAYQAFYDWVVTKMLTGDKHINWLLGKVNKEVFMNRAENIDDEALQEKLTQSKKSNQATYTLGDLGVLQELKNKMENG